MAMPDLQWYLLKLCLIKYESLFFFLFQTVFVAGFLREWLAHFLLIRINGELIRIKHFRVRKKSIFSSTFLISLRFQVYLCSKDIAVFASHEITLIVFCISNLIFTVRLRCPFNFYLSTLLLNICIFFYHHWTSLFSFWIFHLLCYNASNHFMSRYLLPLSFIVKFIYIYPIPVLNLL